MLPAAAIQYNPYHNLLDLAQPYEPRANLPDTPTKARDKYNYSQNLAPAYIPKIYISSADYNDPSKPVERSMIRPDVTLRNLKKLAHRMIVKDKYEVCIAIFFSQACFFYNTKIRLSYKCNADAEVGVPNNSNKSNTDGKFEAAHIATLPTLRIHRDNQEQPIVFGKGSSFHLCANATMWLPKVVNKVDSDLDGKEKNKLLRRSAIKILNAVSRGKYNPKEALLRYLAKAISRLEVILARSEITPEKRIVARGYKKVANSYLSGVKGSDYIIKALSCEFKYDGEKLFKTVQQRMHKLFISEMRAFIPVKDDLNSLKEVPQKWKSLKFKKCLKRFFKFNLKHEILKESETIEKYSTIALKDREVRMVGLQYLVRIPNKRQLRNDLEKIINIKDRETIYQKALPYRVIFLYKKILHSIESRVGRPKNMASIMVKVLVSLNDDLEDV